MPTPLSSDLERLLPGAVLTSPHELRSYARDLWPLQTVRFRAGEDVNLPAAVVRPRRVEDVSRLLAWCSSAGVSALPYGGGSGVCGGVLVDREALGERDAIVADLKALHGVEEIDERCLWCTALAGTLGMDYEESLAVEGLTGAHYPQSLYASTVGGWLACRSAGQASTMYGKAEDMVAGLDVVLASGEVVSLRPQPTSAAGPDLMRIFLGSEGTLGVIVRATMRVVRAPSERLFGAWSFGGFVEGVEAVRRLVQDGVRPAIVRLYDVQDTAFSFPGETGSLLVCVFEGRLAGAELGLAAGALGDGRPEPAKHWYAHRFDAAYQLANVLRSDGILGRHAVADTMEVAASWSRLDELYQSVRAAIGPYCIAVLCHMSHVYSDGACLYFTFALTGQDEPDAQTRYLRAWEAGMEACLEAGGTITHHHGVGRLKARWLRRELGEEGWRLLESLKRALDPSGILNPGNLGLGASP